MDSSDIISALATWTPYLAEGFAWNMVVSAVAMLVGTPVGIALALLRTTASRSLKGTSNFLTMAARSAPTFVMLFYLAYVIPENIVLGGLTITFPAWFKASLALGIAVSGYVSDNAFAAINHLRRSETMEALLFLPAWTSYFLIIVMASSTASVIGVPELVRRSQTVIGAVDDSQFAFWVYLYAMIWFLAFSGVVSLIMRAIRSRLVGRDVEPVSMNE